MDFLQRAQCGFRLLHRDGECYPHIVARVFGATGYVDGIRGRKSVTEKDQAGFPASSSAAHLLGVLELANDDTTEPQSDFAD